MGTHSRVLVGAIADTLAAAEWALGRVTRDEVVGPETREALGEARCACAGAFAWVQRALRTLDGDA